MLTSVGVRVVRQLMRTVLTLLCCMPFAARGQAQCGEGLGEIVEGERCVCPPNTERVGRDLRCVPICPPGRAINCRRHDSELIRNPAASPVELCDCLPSGSRWDNGMPPKLTHCPPLTGEVLKDGDCFCPEGQTYYLISGFWRCRPPCPLPKEWDCSAQLTSLTIGRDLSGTPDAFCRCEEPSHAPRQKNP